MNVSRWRALIPAFLFAFVSWGFALAYVARHDGFGSADLSPFAFWCLLPVALAYPAMRVLQRHAGQVRSTFLLGTAALAGIAFGLAWTFLVALVLGGWIGAFGFPVLLCWITGSVAGFLASATLVRPAIWAAAAGLLVVVLEAVGFMFAWLSTSPPDAIVYIRPDLSDQSAGEATNRIFTMPSEHISNMSRISHRGRVGVRISFLPRTSHDHRVEVLALIKSYAFVDTVVDTRHLTDEDHERFRRAMEAGDESALRALVDSLKL